MIIFLSDAMFNIPRLATKAARSIASNKTAEFHITRRRQGFSQNRAPRRERHVALG